jgi:hypothetical protein
MSKLRIGNKQNSLLNGEWAGHVRGFGKRQTAKIRRMKGKETIIKELKDETDNKQSC